MSARITRPVHEIQKGAERLAAGDFAHKLYVPRTQEFASLAESLNHMAEELDEKIGTLTHERNEREAVLSSMVEGVFGRTFKAQVQPVELAHKLAKEMSDHKTVSVSRIYVPNEYEVYLSPGDYDLTVSAAGFATQKRQVAVAVEVEVVAAAAVGSAAAVAAAAEAAPTQGGAGRLTGSSRPSATGGARNRCTAVRHSWI